MDFLKKSEIELSNQYKFSNTDSLKNYPNKLP